MSVFRASCSSKFFRLESLYSCLKTLGNVSRIKYVKNNDNDCAIVFIEDWKNSYFKQNFNKQMETIKKVVIPKNKKKYWIFTPIEKDELLSIFINDFKNINFHHEVLKQDAV